MSSIKEVVGHVVFNPRHPGDLAVPNYSAAVTVDAVHAAATTSCRSCMLRLLPVFFFFFFSYLLVCLPMGNPVGRASDRHPADAGSIIHCSKGFSLPGSAFNVVHSPALFGNLSRFFFVHGGCADIVRESALKADPGRKILCCSG